MIAKQPTAITNPTSAIDFASRLSSMGRRRSLWRAIAIAWPAVMMVQHGAALAGEFDKAIDELMPRTVKLYGLAAGRQEGFGTGVIVSEDGLVLTVNSLLIDARQVRATDSRGRRFEADTVYRDRQRQLALLQLKMPSGYGSPKTGDELPQWAWFDLGAEATVVPGDWVIAAGNAFKVAQASEPVSIAHGVFSARTRLDARRRVKDFSYTGEVLVIDAITSNPGGPGSPVVNIDGEFLGMIGRNVTSNLTHTHFNYAIPREVLWSFFQEATDPVARAQAIARRREASESEPIDLGIRLAKVGYRQVLPFVERVRRNSLAKRAGVRKDDLILSINGKNVANVDDYHARVRSLQPGELVDIVIRRGQRILAVELAPEAK